MIQVILYTLGTVSVVALALYIYWDPSIYPARPSLGLSWFRILAWIGLAVSLYAGGELVLGWLKVWSTDEDGVRTSAATSFSLIFALLVGGKMAQDYWTK